MNSEYYRGVMDKFAVLGLPDLGIAAGSSSIIKTIKDNVRSKLLTMTPEERKKKWQEIMNRPQGQAYVE